MCLYIYVCDTLIDCFLGQYKLDQELRKQMNQVNEKYKQKKKNPEKVSNLISEIYHFFIPKNPENPNNTVSLYTHKCPIRSAKILRILSLK